jgi:diguanylate cyclase (GGDEF)-like protein/PAS domain S-box-containing protein
MNANLSLWRSLKARVTLFTLAIFMLSIWALSFFVGRLLQQDMERLLGEQQFSTVSFSSAQVDDEIRDRFAALEFTAKEVGEDLNGKPSNLQARLEQPRMILSLFNAGIFISTPDGTTLASVPVAAGRIGVNYMERDQIVTSLRDGKPAIGKPVMGKQLRVPVFAMTVPIRNAQGRVIGAISGVVDLSKPNFLDKIMQTPYGRTGGFLLIAPKYRQIVTATDKKRVMEVLPVAGVNRYVDRNIAGYEGYSVLSNALGEEQLASVKQMPASGWYMLLGTPTAEAFEPVRSMLQRIRLATLLLTLLAGGLTWRMLKRQFRPLTETANAMVALSEKNQIPQPLVIHTDDEIGQLSNSFNRLIATWTQRESALRKSEQNLAITLNSIGDAVISTDQEGRITGMNPTAERLTAWPLAEALGQPLDEVFHIINAQTRQPGVNPVELVLERGEVVAMADHTTLRARDGREWQIADSAAPIRNPSSATVGVVMVFSDVSEKYRGELALKASEQQYRSLLENLSSGVVVHRPDTSIVLSNAMAASLLGLTQEQMLGKSALDPDWCFLRDDETPMPLDDHPVNRVLASGLTLQNYLLGVRHPGRTEPTWVICNAYPMRDDNGKILQAVVTFTDITQRRQADAALIASEERWKFAIEGAGDGLWDWNIRTGKAFYSSRYKTMLGFAEGEIGETADEWSKRIHPEDAPGVYAALQPYMDGKPGSAAVEFRMLCKDGSWMWTLGRGMVVQRDTNGKALRMIGTNSDITGRKLTEANLQLAASVFGHAREGITITNASGIILDVNQAFTRITGYSRDEAIGQNPSILKSGRQDKAFYEAMWDELTGAGHWSGEVWNRRKNGEVYAELLTISAVRDAQGNTQQYVALFSDITGIKDHQSQLERIAHFDALTNLPNRVLLADRLQQAMLQAQRRQKQLAVAYLDLDGFKAINDHHGHEVGDYVLIALAQRMKQALREGDTLARLGGDEFVAVMGDLDDTADSLTLLNRLLASAAQPVLMGELTLQVSASLGVTFYPQAQDIDADQLLRQADQAMYQAKLAGKNRYHVFDAAQDGSIRDQHEKLERIRLALEQGEFVLHYQPKVNMHSGKVIGAEALIRWQHPEKGILAPATFLPVIEDHPLAVDVGEWVIDTAMHQMEVWHAVGLDLPVSVNIGARQLQQGDFVERLQAILAKHPQVHPACIEMEVLETSALSDMALVSQVIEDCAKNGVKFALDDFGTGYSSLTYLKRLRVALLKIDRSFVRDMLDDPDDLAILKGVIGLAAAFKREVIAEGVETVAHGTLLLQLGCELAQGYGIARPMPPEQLPAWAATWQPDAAWCVLPCLGGDDSGTDG